MQNYSSLNMYIEIKTAINRERYLTTIDNPTHRKAVSNLRLSCCKLPIVTGRYSNIDRCNRICTKCKYKVGTEYHCIMECFYPNISDIRNQYLMSIFTINPALKQFDRKTLFQYILLFNDNNISKLTAKFIYNVLQIYQ